MTKVKIDDNSFRDLGEAIRDKKKVKTKMLLSEMPDLVKSIIWRGTQAEFDELETIDMGTLYIIEEAEE